MADAEENWRANIDLAVGELLLSSKALTANLNVSRDLLPLLQRIRSAIRSLEQAQLRPCGKRMSCGAICTEPRDHLEARPADGKPWRSHGHDGPCTVDIEKLQADVRGLEALASRTARLLASHTARCLDHEHSFGLTGMGPCACGALP